MKRKLKPIGRLDNGIFTLDEDKHKDFFKKITNEDYKLKLQKWFLDQVENYCRTKHKGHFLIYLYRGKGGARLKLEFDLEKYRDEKSGGFKLPISDLW